MVSRRTQSNLFSQKLCSAVFALLLVGIVRTGNCQEITQLIGWTHDPFKSTQWAEVIAAKSQLTGVSGTTVKLSLSCRRITTDGKIAEQSSVDFGLDVTGGTMDVRNATRSIQIPHTTYENSLCPSMSMGGPRWVPCNMPTTTYTSELVTDHFVDWTERFAQ